MQAACAASRLAHPGGRLTFRFSDALREKRAASHRLQPDGLPDAGAAGVPDAGGVALWVAPLLAHGDVRKLCMQGPCMYGSGLLGTRLLLA